MFSDKWINILNEVESFHGGNNAVWFRGQNNEKYTLNSGLYRLNLNDPDDYVEKERGIYKSFMRRAYTLTQARSWELLFIMQHHGVRTRLLDWTESFAVALFFAALNWEKDSNCAVWLLNPIGLNYRVLGREGYFTPNGEYLTYINPKNVKLRDKSLALYPFKNSPRIIAQQGMFTIQGVGNRPLEDEYGGELLDTGILKKIVITNELRNDVFRYLKLNGISNFSMFPDLDGLALDINRSLENRIDKQLIQNESLSQNIGIAGSNT
ncbi:FRG domain-containing protein [Bacillus subtilis]|uniref:FRG domain-containing protein n=1 Tax=Bacillus subtilis TaxID=1423 RepID=UPI003D7E82FB